MSGKKNVKTRMFGNTEYTFFASYNEPQDAYADAKFLRRMYPVKAKIDPNGLDHYGLYTGEKAIIWIAKETNISQIKKVEQANKPHIGKRLKEIFG